MCTKLCEVLLFLLGIKNCLATDVVHLSGNITGGTQFHSRDLSQFPSKAIRVGFAITYDTSHQDQDKVDPLMKFYTEHDHKDFSKGCISSANGQFLNDYLFVPIKKGRYKSRKCTFLGNTTIIKCVAKLTIQDYLVRKYSLAFGYRCRDTQLKHNLTLIGLSYNITVIRQTNITKCTRTPLLPASNLFSGICSDEGYTLFPNLFGHQDAEQAQKSLKRIINIKNFHEFYHSPVSLFDCHQHQLKSMCQIFYARCMPEKQLVTHVCRKMCHNIFHACWEMFLQFALLFPNQPFLVDDFSKFQGSCDYLPSHTNNQTPCYYEPIECKYLPQVENAHPTNQSLKGNMSFSVNSTVVYLSNSEEYFIQGNNEISCQPNGKWSELPTCVKTVAPRKPIFFLIPIFVFAPLTRSAYILWLRCSRRETHKKRAEEIKTKMPWSAAMQMLEMTTI